MGLGSQRVHIKPDDFIMSSEGASACLKTLIVLESQSIVIYLPGIFSFYYEKLKRVFCPSIKLTLSKAYISMFYIDISYNHQ